ncbi:HXXEE domain-containing protein [uncultured Roseibium sp.]|uniref:HXXEE domain-containing protein n=1 Tax=uncultured Roseibium sp. TaxID=1936171 RepID=UPI0026167EC0|nr:HXXEE domain-containing protein [uncultured Roseibium sp.]
MTDGIEQPSEGRAGRLTANWVYGALPLALFLIGFAPFVDGILLPVYLALPVYMLHQYEEHDADRFRKSINLMLGPQARGLGNGAVWIINVVFVWFLLLAVFFAARVAPGWGVVAAYLMAINALVHIAAAIRTRQGNPGLVTAIVLFLPLSAWILAAQPASLVQHLTGAALILALHGAIAAWATRPVA